MSAKSRLKEKVKLEESSSRECLRKLIDGTTHERSNQVILNEAVSFADMEAKVAIKYFKYTQENPYSTFQQ